MSFIADMKPIMLQVKAKVKKPSGATAETWQDVQNIDVAIYNTDDMKVTQSVRYNQSSNVGISFYKAIDKDMNRLVDGTTIYTITKVNPRGRLTSLLLKAVDTNE